MCELYHIAEDRVDVCRYTCWKRVKDCSARQRHPVTVVIHEALHERIHFPRDTRQGDERLTVIRVSIIIIRSPHVLIRMRNSPDGAP